jgi:diguanylate cyclase (GGDEF)-like protein/PAS domain S-box-containing protein
MAAFSIEWADNTRDPVGSKRSSRFVRAKMSTGFGLRARVVALIVMVAAPLIALLLFETSEERGVALDHAHARVADLARVSAAQEDNDLQDARTLVLVLGRVAEIREALAPGADAGRCHALLRKVVQDHPQVAAITVTGPGGWAACGSHTPKPDVDFSDRDWFIAAIAPDAAPVVASRVIMSRQLGRPTVVVASRTPAANAGEPALGVVSASLDLGWLSSLASQYPQDGPAIAGIIDPGTGAVLAHSKGRTDDLGQISTDPALLDAIRSHPEGGSVETTVAGGAGQIIGFAPLPGGPTSRAVVYVSLQRDAVLAAANWRAIRSVGVTAGGLLAALVIGCLLASRVLLRPIRLLADAARGMGEGRLDLKAPVARLGAAEFRDLGEALNAMAASLDGKREALARSEELYRVLTENMTDVVVLMDPEFHRLYVSPAANEMLGCAPETLVGRTGFELVHPADRPAVRLAKRALEAGEPGLCLEVRVIRPDGRTIWAQMIINRLEDGRGYVATLRDITDRRDAEEGLLEANRKLETMASEDALTGVANRRRFDEMLQHEWRRARRDGAPLCLLLIDVDHFKAFNDRYGHQAGDQCLRRVSAAITDVLRKSRDMVSRYGGEEFTVILPGAAHHDAMAIAERIRLTIREAGMNHDGVTLAPLTVSIGLASALPATDGDDPAVLLHKADGALYAAKRQGRDRVAVHAADADYLQPMQG